MRTFLALALMGVSMLLAPAFVGCDEKKAETKTEVTRPDGTTKTDKVEVKQSSDGAKKTVTEEHKDTGK
jgi:ABC-type oligopeptide transport system substrate-binding subunit